MWASQGATVPRADAESGPIDSLGPNAHQVVIPARQAIAVPIGACWPYAVPICSRSPDSPAPHPGGDVMPVVTLDARTVNKLPVVPGRRVEHFDDSLPGFALRV